MQTSLQQLVHPYIDELYENIPAEIRERLLAEHFESDSWNRYSWEGRLDFVRLLDKIRDARDAELAEVRAAQEYWFNLQDEIFEITRQIDLLDSKTDVLGLGNELLSLQARWSNPAFKIGSPEQIDLEKNRAAGNTSIVNVQEAVKFLTQNTGAAWTEAQILAIAAQCHVTLCAVVPPWVRMYINRFFDVESLGPAPYVKPGCSILATVSREMVESLWVTGKAEAGWVSTDSFSGAKNLYFTVPVPLTLIDIRLTRAQLLRILNEWEALRRVLASPASPSAARPMIEGLNVRHKLRTNSLDAPIKKAINKAGSIETGAVYLELREMALHCENPFTGEFDGDALCYTKDDNRTAAKLTKDALGKRLKNHAL